MSEYTKMLFITLKSILFVVHTKEWPWQISKICCGLFIFKETEKIMLKKILSNMFLILFSLLLFTGCSEQKEPIGTATISIRCDTAIANEMQKEEKWKGILPEDGCILSETEMPVYEGDTVFDLLIAARDDYEIQMEYHGAGTTAYIEGIGNLYEYDGGRWSGWMFRVNGEYPEVGCGQLTLKDGDTVEWNYTCDLGLDLDAGMEDAQEWKDNHQ